jgi:N-methylhydantoinase A/oxoprolinase/acetone carboxylase beta subunit
MRIGIDVGGTNTDAVLLDGRRVLAEHKTSTTEDVTFGITNAITRLHEISALPLQQIDAVMIGTTHFVNALVEAKHLAPTAAIRIGLPATSGLPPFVGWPERLRTAMNGQGWLVAGGHEYDGRRISEFSAQEFLEAVDKAATNGARSLAISSVFSPVKPELELEAAELVAQNYPELTVSLSHEVGRIGLLERENATIINAALRELADTICDGLGATLKELGIHGQLFLSQNDGTLMDVDYARRYPVSTFASGPTNSMRGAAFLSGRKDCIVVDVGGTTTDVGVLANGFPRESSTEIEVAGLRTNFRMPDVLSVGIGGGRFHREQSRIGPDSVGYRVRTEALVFGGATLTATDIAVAAGRAELGDPSLADGLDAALVERAMAVIDSGIEEAIDRMRTSADPVCVVAVGGGSILMPPRIECAAEVIRPQHFAVANAIGAAIAQVGGEVDRVFAVPAGGRQSVLDQARQMAVDKAVAAGADLNTVEIVEVDELPLAYLPGNASRIRVKAVGDLADDTRSN